MRGFIFRRDRNVGYGATTIIHGKM
jgi:hypothetical protein